MRVSILVIITILLLFYTNCDKQEVRNQNESDIYRKVVEYIYRDYSYFNEDTLQTIIIRDTLIYERFIISSCEYQYANGELINPDDILDLITESGLLKDSLPNQIDLHELNSDFRKVNLYPEKIENLISKVSVDLVLISKDNYNKFYNGDDYELSWNNFLKTYPKSIGPISLSRIGFNDSQDQAVLFINIMGYNFLEGKYLYFSKQNNKWSIIGEYPLYKPNYKLVDYPQNM